MQPLDERRQEHRISHPRIDAADEDGCELRRIEALRARAASEHARRRLPQAKTRPLAQLTQRAADTPAKLRPLARK